MLNGFRQWIKIRILRLCPFSHHQSDKTILSVPYHPSYPIAMRNSAQKMIKKLSPSITNPRKLGSNGMAGLPNIAKSIKSIILLSLTHMNCQSSLLISAIWTSIYAMCQFLNKLASISTWNSMRKRLKKSRSNMNKIKFKGSNKQSIGW